MASDYEKGSPDDRLHSGNHPAVDAGYQGDMSWQNGGRRTPDSGYHNRPAGSPGPRTPGHPDRDWDDGMRQSSERNRSKPRSGRSASGQQRICKKCELPLTGQFVRALDGTFHLDCFKCRDCGEIVASKFFPAEDENGGGQYPLCETDYFRRLGLLCYQCGGALRGSYITALDRKYHVDHFTCSLCPTVFGAQDSYYEHNGNVYCHYHYSTQFAQRCNGCQTAILKQFVEIFRNGQNQHWHPECYMIHKFWNVRLTQPSESPKMSQEYNESNKDVIKEEEERMEEKVYRIWSVLSTFEESSAACISDMLLHVSNGGYVDGVLVAKKFIWHVEVLFQAADRLDATMVQLRLKGLSYGREAKLLCKKIVSFFSLLSKSQDTGARKLGVTQELLSLVTGLAHYLKLLIRICLQGALRLEKESKSSDGIYQFLDDLSDVEQIKLEDNSLQITSGASKLSAKDSDHCALCNKSVEDECAKNMDKRWHISCVQCARCGKEMGRKLEDARWNAFDKKIYCNNCVAINSEDMPAFEHVTKLQQYVFLLKVALARLLDILRNSGALPSASDDVTNGYNSAEGSRAVGDRDAPHLTMDARSKSYAGDPKDHQRESSYENTLNDVRRLRSTRLDKHLSSSFRKARTSRVMDGPEGPTVRPGSADGDHGDRGGQGLQTLEDRGRGDEGTSDLMFGHENALTLDDIPRIVAAEQVREQYNPQRQELFRSPATEPHLGHQRSHSTGRDVDARMMGEPMPQRMGRRYFSELPALEYFIVRHLAVLTMHPMLEQEFTLEELLSFIETRKSPTFWKNLGKAFKNDKTKGVKKKGVFGVPLEVIIERDGAESTDGVGPGTLRIPAIVDDLIASMRKMDLSVEGVFRKNGNIKKLADLCERIDREGADNINFMEQPVVQVAALLKRYLRELPDPLMTHKLHRLWLAVAKIQDNDKRRQCLHLTCCLLPRCHRDCLEILFCFLKWAGSFHQVDEENGSRMDIRNLATVIAPNVLYSNSKTAALDSDPMYAIDAVDGLINYIEEMCLVPDEVMDLLNDPFIFGNNSDLTTKEILKRYQDRAGQAGQRPGYGEVNEAFNRSDNSTRPPARKVETDPALWQQESSVRPVNEPAMPYNHPNPGTPPPKWRNPEDSGHPSPYAQQFDHSDTNLEQPDGSQRRDWRNSGWRQNGGVGVGGNI